ncbi:MAG: ubiquinone/menaquinone biosynthesis methyltransferase [Myxococcota bacterium]|nr:ubiquinone/menaquinone biosynthesis methyltransferase [Myxococcota bacterium]
MSGPVAGDPNREEAVRDMFDRIAPTYVKANSVLTMGIDKLWRRKGLAALGACIQGPMLDLCAGTMDLSIALLDAGCPEVVAYDFSPGMLEVGKQRLPEGAPVEAVVGDAQDMPWEGPRFHGAIAAFGLRNVPDNEKALREAFRVLHPGGRLVVLEFFQPVRVDQKVFHSVVNKVVLPTVGGWISGDSQAYGYLADSMTAYLTRERFQQIAQEVGFQVLQGQELLPPVASLVALEKPGSLP